MPRGDHFKKENPRIHQVSSKVNESEMKMLKENALKAGVPIAQWLRDSITSDLKTEKITPSKSTPSAKKNQKPKVEKVAKNKKVKDYGNDSTTEQMSLF